MVRTARHLLRWSALCTVIIAVEAVPRLWADPNATASTAPATQPAATLLQQLSDETQQLYRQSRHSMVRVQLPTPQWLEQYNQQQAFLKKWGAQLNPEVREKILEEQDRAFNALHHAATNPATQSSDISSTSPTTQVAKGELQVTDAPHPGDVGISLFAIGLLVDGQGHAVFPVYVDHKYLGNTPLPAVTGEGQVTTATFVGSDPKTHLSVLQLADHSGTPAALGHRRPEDGTLTLVIAIDGGARMAVWNNQHYETGFAILPDGAVAGFGFEHGFLAAATAKPIVDQLIATGEVRRAILGVVTQEVDRDDGLRRQRPQLGSSPAIRIVAVQKGSAAERGGIQADDLILAIGDQAVGDAPTFAAVIATRTGDTTLKVLRGNKTLELTVNLQPK
jgi:hypothetical protein